MPFDRTYRCAAAACRAVALLTKSNITNINIMISMQRNAQIRSITRRKCLRDDAGEYAVADAGTVVMPICDLACPGSPNCSPLVFVRELSGCSYLFGN